MKFPITITEGQFRLIALTGFMIGFLTSVACNLLFGWFQ